jgi:hypothetical protein
MQNKRQFSIPLKNLIALSTGSGEVRVIFHSRSFEEDQYVIQFGKGQ